MAGAAGGLRRHHAGPGRRLGGCAGFAGLIMTGDTMFLPLVIGAGMKICYDLILWRAFRGIKPPEERT